ncbi:MAG TPA: cysteine peptidase family C39 domain-containing protein [Gammaproteobacteria bacterium]|nr:cysteine peptidase family C39 domain-containing protein [Gammaproteobacteria bacterium]
MMGPLVLLMLAVGAHAAATPWHAIAEPNVSAMRSRERTAMERLGGRVLASRGAWLQATPADCGVAVVREAVRTLQAGRGRVPSRDSVAALTGASARGTTLDGLARALDVLGAHTRRADHALPSGATVYVAHLRAGHFVLLRRTSRDTVWMFDPLVGEIAMEQAAFRALWSGAGLRVDGQAGLAQRRARTSARAGT